MAFQKALDKFGNKGNYGDLGSSMAAHAGGTRTYGGRSFSTFQFLSAMTPTTGNASLFTRNAAGTITVAPGYRYRVTVKMQPTNISMSNCWTAWQLTANGTQFYNRIYIPHLFNSFGNGIGSEAHARGIFDATTSTTIALVNWEGTTAANFTFDGNSDILVEVVGVL